MNDLYLKHNVHMTMDISLPDGSMTQAQCNIAASHKTIAYASMAAAIKQYALQHNVAPQDVRYSSTWIDGDSIKAPST
jgi:hypothetical protein